jgi:glutamate-1-semialdehyde 2,1-aminomutase
MPYISLSFSHKEKELEITLKAVKNSLEIYKKALLEGISNYLESSVIKPVFRKYN